MTDAPKKPKRQFKHPENLTGRTPKTIDWDVLDDLLTAGCTGMQAAAHFGIHHDTFYRKVEEKYGVSFTAYSQQKYSKGESLLMAKQFAKALGLEKDGDNMMLVWLGKNRLKQSDTPAQDSINEQALQKYEAVMNQLNNLQSSRSSLSSALKIDEINSKSDAKS